MSPAARALSVHISRSTTLETSQGTTRSCLQGRLLSARRNHGHVQRPSLCQRRFASGSRHSARAKVLPAPFQKALSMSLLVAILRAKARVRLPLLHSLRLRDERRCNLNGTPRGVSYQCMNTACAEMKGKIACREYSCRVCVTAAREGMCANSGLLERMYRKAFRAHSFTLLKTT